MLEMASSMDANMQVVVLSADYSGALTLLLRYPSPYPHAPSTFVRDALYLEQNPTVGRGKFIVSKYSGKPPEHVTHTNVLGGRSLAAAKIPIRRGSKDTINNDTSSRDSPKNLEGFLQDVSEGIQRRTGNWGVAKAVRGAVTEAKKNMQSIHAEKDPQSPPAGGRAEEKEEKPPSLHKAQIDLGNKVEYLEERNKMLAKNLGQALNDLHQGLLRSGALEGDTNRVTREAFLKVQSIRSCLEDSSVPVDGTSDCVNASQESLTGKKSRSDSEEDGEQSPPSSKEVKPRDQATKPTESSTDLNDSRGRGNGLSGHARSNPRASLADSEFSWMLEGSRQLSEFVDSSVTPEQVRHRNSKQGPLFGGGEEQDAGFDGMAMNSLRGSKNQK